MDKGGQPIYIIDPSKEQTKGKDVLSMNIAAAKAVANIVKSTLGPRGMDKMLVNPLGDVTITNDGATILHDMSIEHPTAKMLVEVAQSLESSAGDGTTSAVVFSGALLEKAEDLIENGVHPSVVVKGYRFAAEKAVEILEDLAITAGEEDRELLIKTARTSITGKASEKYSRLIAELCVDAVLAIHEDGKADLKNIILTKDIGGLVEKTEFVEGVVIDKVALDKNFPLKIVNPNIALIDAPMETAKTANKAKLQINNVSDIENFVKQEDAALFEMADYIIRAGANAVFCSKGMDDKVSAYLQSRGIYATRRVKSDDMQHLADATGGRPVRNIKELTEKELGHAGLLEQDRDDDQGKTYLRDCKGAKSVSIVLRGGTEHVVDNLERAIDDALKVVKCVVEDGKVVAGGGASEMAVALSLRSYASSVGGREQMAITAFAEALEEIPRTIARNAGLDAINTILNLRAKHAENKNAGLNILTGDAEDMLEKGVVDPLRVKVNSIKSGSETAAMVLRVDSMLRAQSASMQEVKPEHMASTYEGMSAPALNMHR
ncbi:MULTISPECIES: thermosome subunit alpha [unclassified Methanosarcina]|uniref:thermosome subunit alpha n=1 Tax=unclassified Methanosarcina TaxID=2644672 RepID=UPI00061573C2|nr:MULTISPECIES: thermosome subunit alpha [unclassified Methanosarcina]AKB19922.1 Heat shock protein 60 family chaperone GroEL [Methanosarcina sp. WWM596]AKB22282.1 Heat shock protein 60 family chaperone GroEL [Methanosarcina sp. WH1]